VMLISDCTGNKVPPEIMTKRMMEMRCRSIRMKYLAKTRIHRSLE
jgi:hypothetical protein